MSKLNAGQQAACDGFFSFLFNDEKELIISGPGGTGKTYLMGYLIDEILPRYHNTCSLMGIPIVYDTVAMTATTNKAAEVLGEATDRPTNTIHSFLGLRVKEDFSTGKTILSKTNNWKVHKNIIIFVDEASMCDSQLLRCIREGTNQCKVIYVGDHSQLPPVFEDMSPIYKENLPFYELTEPMRNASQTALVELCGQIRETVATGIFKPIKSVPGVIDWFQEDSLLDEVESHFVKATTDSRILAYANSVVHDVNTFIRSEKGLPDRYTAGELLVSNSATQLAGNSGISIEEPVEVLKVSPFTETIEMSPTVSFEVVRMDIKAKFGGTFAGVPVPVDRVHFEQLVKYFAKIKDWVSYFYLKNKFPDLRPRSACTVHKSQGSTYDTVFVDLNNLSTCHQPKIVARLLYVAVTRPRKRIVFYGNLAPKYGGIS